MLMLVIAAEGLLIVGFAGDAADPFAGEEQNKENRDNDKRHKIRGFLSIIIHIKTPGETSPRSRSDYSMFWRQRKACNSISFIGLFCAGGQFSQS